MKSLVLAEKPSVAREIARVLNCHKKSKHYIEGDKYIVTWALGHLVELKMPEHYNSRYRTWNLEDLPIIPKRMELMPIRQTNQQFRGIKQLLNRKDIKDCIIATDAGREGELVARWALELLNFRKPLKRLWISSQTDKAIKDGFRQLKAGKEFDNLYNSAVCRAEADWLIGLNVTRALTTKYNDQLSAGRVQTPSLALVHQHEEKIKSFKARKYWVISGNCGGLKVTWRGKDQEGLFNKTTVSKIIERCENKEAILKNIKVRRQSEQQPLPYDLTELQRDANRRFNFSAKKTANVLQRLYEQHKLVTYPRTDSRYLTSDIENTMRERLEAISGGYKAEVNEILKAGGKVLARRTFNNKLVTDHHAIIPTEQFLQLDDLDNDERRLYNLIVQRFLGLFHPRYEYEKLEAEFEFKGDSFYANEIKVTEIGFKSLFGENIDDNKSLQHLVKGQSYKISTLQANEHLTQAPPRYSEADLLSRMEKHNLGTPATRADIIERLIDTGTVERHNNRLSITRKGEQLISLVNEDLKSPELTAQWEGKLEEIAKGKGDPKKFMADINKLTKKLVSEVKQSQVDYKHHDLTASKCPDCDSLLRERNTRNGKILICSNRECSYRRRRDPKLSNRRCPQCRKKLEIHQGKAGTYFQCRPCNFVEKAEDRRKKVSKRDQRRLMKKYSPAEESFGNNLGDLLQEALNKKE